jgi:hypothetical protein
MPPGRPEPFLSYRHFDGSDPQVLLRCTPQHAAPPFPGCNGKVLFEPDGLALYVIFPRDHLANWRDIVSAARGLFKSWKAAE